MTRLEKAYSEWLALQPLDEQTRYRISQRFTIDFNYNSNHIEGNTLTYGQTELLLLFGKVMGEANINFTRHYCVRIIRSIVNCQEVNILPM